MNSYLEIAFKKIMTFILNLRSSLLYHNLRNNLSPKILVLGHLETISAWQFQFFPKKRQNHSTLMGMIQMQKYFRASFNEIDSWFRNFIPMSERPIHQWFTFETVAQILATPCRNSDILNTVAVLKQLHRNWQLHVRILISLTQLQC